MKTGGAPNWVRLAARQHGSVVTKRARWVAWVGLGDPAVSVKSVLHP